MTTTYVASGQTYTGPIAAGDEVVVESGGSTAATDIAGVETIELGGNAVAPIVEDGGTLVAQPKSSDPGVYTTASVTGGTIEAGGTFDNSGDSSNVAVYGIENVSTTANLADGSVYPVSFEDTVYAGGVINFGAGGTAYAPTIAGGTVNLENAKSGLVAPVMFEGPSGLLEISLQSNLNAPIDGFGPGDLISIAGFNSTDATTLAVSGDAVTVAQPSGNAPPFTIDLAGASADDLQLADVNNLLTLECVCFLAGTTITTPAGGRAIEALKAGDLVLTDTGAAEPVRWLGRQTVHTRFADTTRVAPIRIRAGALAQGVPWRDLLVSPDHALMVDGIFVQAGALVNGVSITREERHMPERFTYFHVELASHALILAEGVAAETFIDNVDRLAFDNWGEHAALGRDGARMSEMPHARAKSHRQVPRGLHARLMARARELGGMPVAAAA